MQFRIADTFTDSLAKLTRDEQKAVKTTAFDLQVDPAHPGLKFHKLDRARDKRFWSVRVSRDLRLIVHKTAENFLLCYVDHHDKAYQWAERRKLEVHPQTGAAQLVEIRETVQEIIVPTYVQREMPKPLLFEATPTEELLGYGVPLDWMEEVRKVDEDSLLDLADHLPAEAAEALLDVATGGTPKLAPVAQDSEDPFAHPDAQRRFRVIDNREALAQALEYPWEKWTLFLHPDQKQYVEKRYHGPARISGSAGTGKTVVALHRAVFLARTNPEARVLLTTFSSALAHALDIKIKRLIHHEPLLGERLEVHALPALGQRLHRLHLGVPRMVSSEQVSRFLQEAAQAVKGHPFSLRFLQAEWEQVIDAWQLNSWEAYRDVTRLGRRVRLPEAKRQQLWALFSHVRETMAEKGLLTPSAMFHRLAMHYDHRPSPFEFIVVDEAQDISVAQLRLLGTLAGTRPDGLFFAGDLGQRIFQQPFSWQSLGVSVRGRSRTLRINYRTSHQIRKQADLLLGKELTDADGNVETRTGTISVFNGPKPNVQPFDTPREEIAGVAKWLSARIADGVVPEEIGVFVRTQAELERAVQAVKQANLSVRLLDETMKLYDDQQCVSISTMHLAKGLEFRAVVVMACDDEIIPLAERIETVSEESDLDEVYRTERHLLYVACTRARDYLLVSSGDLPSEFLDDLCSKK